MNVTGPVLPPPGETVNPNPRPWLFTANCIAIAVGLALSTVFLVIRIYTKARILRKFWWDDVFILLAWVFSVSTQAVIIYGCLDAGFAIDIWDLSVSELVTYRKTILAMAVIHIQALAFAKFAVLMLYYRVLKFITPWRYTLWAVGSSIGLYSVILVFMLIFACVPIEDGWSLTRPSACRRRSGLYLATAIANTASDSILLLIPMIFIWALNLPFMQKIGLFCLLGLGCLTVVTSIVRLVTLIPLLDSNNQPHNIGLVCLFIVLEANFIILCGCLPFTRAFLHHYAPKWFSSRNGSRGDRYYLTGTPPSSLTSPSHMTPPSNMASPAVSSPEYRRRPSYFDIEAILNDIPPAECSEFAGPPREPLPAWKGPIRSDMID
ncbi:uncharacterized protein BO72DRAFT_61788 [Aspergillus fijiensis CBS 313.89]|uniref:Rhodopsin domain-containing protein n=1 Tax=Aspergillus fijiensis CBS 313.89 TaxID=1448319 RepID=A0A8G1RTF3_9EURO|nr:uncharacterized protein BO72DRAFT_61788 [Aspergillus fijiensis CBS 313.89]RAK78939.1 hypothetical protein BO72DRAFT_61788 [Aspergillus fijiensis CBS 313.89]